MSWNVENLFDVGAEDGPETQAQLTAKVESLRAVIDVQRPHVLALQEVGSENALARLRAASTLAMPYRAVAAPDARGSRVAFLSRRLLREPRQIRPFPAKDHGTPRARAVTRGCPAPGSGLPARGSARPHGSLRHAPAFHATTAHVWGLSHPGPMGVIACDLSCCGIERTSQNRPRVARTHKAFLARRSS